MKTMSNVEYRENRARFSPDELRKHDGKWVAFSLDGKRIVASAVDIVELANEVRAAHEDMHDVGLEFIDCSDEIYLGGAEFL